MFVQKIKLVVLLAVLACLCGCGPMDSLLPSNGTYKINFDINDTTLLNELSFISSNDKIHPFFEESVSDDPDVTALVVFLRNARGNTVGWKVIYTIEETENERRDAVDNFPPDLLLSPQGSPQGSTQDNPQSSSQDSSQSSSQDSSQSSPQSSQQNSSQNSQQSSSQSSQQSSQQNSSQNSQQSSSQGNPQSSQQSSSQNSSQSSQQSSSQNSSQGSQQSSPQNSSQSSQQNSSQSSQQSSSQSNQQSSSQSSQQSSSQSSQQNSSQSNQQSSQQNSSQSGQQSSSQSSQQNSSQSNPRGEASLPNNFLETTKDNNLTEDEILFDDDEDAVVIENGIITDGFKDGDELVITVKSLDKLPVFPLPDNLPVGRYTLVSHVMSGKDILQKIEKSIFYMGRTVFSYDGIQVHLPGIAESTQVIPKGMVVMLETVLDFDSRLNPYIIWYHGRRKIAEGNFSDGAGYLLWKAPEQSGFFSLRAEVFPVSNYSGLSGYMEGISLLVSSKDIDLNFISEDIPQLLHWYTFEGKLNDLKMLSSAERALKTDAKNKPKWAGINGTYGLLAGSEDNFSLPNVLVTNDGTETWQILFRFKPLKDGVILSVRFANSDDILMNLKTEDHNLVLELVSPAETITQIHALPEQDSFIKAGVIFTILPEMLSANLNIMGDYIINSEVEWEQAGIAAEIEGGFQILLGQKPVGGGESEAGRRREFTAIWDEFVLYFMPPEELFSAYLIEEADEELSQDDELLED